MVELKLFLMPPLKRSGRVKAFLENTTRRVEIFQKSRLGLDSSLEDRFIILHQKQLGSTILILLTAIPILPTLVMGIYRTRLGKSYKKWNEQLIKVDAH